MGEERRRYPRAKVDLGVTLEAEGSRWQGKTVNLSPYGAKVALVAESAQFSPGTSVQLSLAMPDEDPPLSVAADVRRADRDGAALNFVGLEDEQFRRLKALVDSSLKREWEELVIQLGADQQMVARGTFAKFLDDKPAGERRFWARGAQAATLERPSAAEDDSERERFQALLNRLGFSSLQLPSNGTLARQWRDFLRRLEAEEE